MSTRYNPIIHAQIIESVRAGVPKRHIAQGVGISPQTLYTWLNKGRQGEEPFVVFAKDFDRVSVEHQRDMLVVIKTAAKDDWRAAAWTLERLHPRDYSLQPELRKAADESEQRSARSRLDEVAEPDELDIAAHLNALGEREGGDGD